MTTTYSPNLALTLLGTTAQDVWGGTTNTNLSELEQAISGYYIATIPDTTSGLTLAINAGATDNSARNVYIECQGTLTATRPLNIPPNQKLYYIYNNTVGGYPVQVISSNPGDAGTYVPNGVRSVLVFDGSNTVPAITAVTPATVANLSGGTANEIVFQSAPSVTSFVTAPSTPNTFLQWNGSAFNWASAGGGGGGGTTTNPVTFDNSGMGAAPGVSFDGSAAETISFNTIGALGLASFTGSNVSIGQFGYQTMPSGIIIQWGTLPSQSNSNYHAYTFATNGIEFPNACFCIFMQPYQTFQNSAIAGAGTSVYVVQGLTRTGFNYIMSSNWNIGGSTEPALYWFAIGY
jgi:hypothetical protein